MPFEVHCDMTSFGGGWTMCYTTDSHVNIKTELTTTPDRGYRADCNKIPVNISLSFFLNQQDCIESKSWLVKNMVFT